MAKGNYKGRTGVEKAVRQQEQRSMSYGKRSPEEFPYTILATARLCLCNPTLWLDALYCETKAAAEKYRRDIRKGTERYKEFPMFAPDIVEGLKEYRIFSRQREDGVGWLVQMRVMPRNENLVF